MTLLLTACLIFWGWVTGVLWLGALLALLLFATMAFNAKYDFEAASFYQVANFSALIVVAIFTFYWLDDKASKSILPTVRLLPVALMPLLIMQYISKGFEIPVAALLFFKRKVSDNKPSFDMSVLFFAVCLFSAGGVADLGLIYFTGISVLMLLLLLIQHHGKGSAHVTLLVLMFLAAETVGLGVVYGIQDAQMKIEARINAWLLAYNDGSKASTALGELGRLKLSDAIVFRVQTDERLPMPMLLREGSYQRYVHGTWYGGAWQDKAVPLQDDRWQLLQSSLPMRHLQISQSFARDTFSLALPQTTTAISNLDVDSLLIKQGGRVEAQGLPPFVAFDVWYHPQLPQTSAVQRSDLDINQQQAKSIAQFVKKHDLYQIKFKHGEHQAVQALANIFQQQYQYSTWQKAYSSNKTALAYFLEDSFAGHCEYFATATVLILRELGIPARYVVGYSMSEWDDDMYVVRGRDANAWAEALVDGVWVSIDNTPANWLKIENQDRAVWQGLVDWFSALGFKFKQWRYQGEKDTTAWYGLLALLFVILAYRILKRVRTVQNVTDEIEVSCADKGWLSLEQALNEAGYQRKTGQTLQQWFLMIDGGQWSNIAELFEKKWYAKYGLSEREHVLLSTKVKGLKNMLDEKNKVRA
ncbi:MAG: transglutaminase-like domain-containing protein [Ghiorsea sp.]|nr:transglutaminase-like domain-containing protein [Ghiorsea sp.]